MNSRCYNPSNDYDHTSDTLDREYAIVKAVVEKHRGTMVVESMGPDRRSIFKVILPAFPDEI
jgi:hypothetical protein